MEWAPPTQVAAPPPNTRGRKANPTPQQPRRRSDEPPIQRGRATRSQEKENHGRTPANAKNPRVTKTPEKAAPRGTVPQLISQIEEPTRASPATVRPLDQPPPPKRARRSREVSIPRETQNQTFPESSDTFTHQQPRRSQRSRERSIEILDDVGTPPSINVNRSLQNALGSSRKRSVEPSNASFSNARMYENRRSSERIASIRSYVQPSNDSPCSSRTLSGRAADSTRTPVSTVRSRTPAGASRTPASNIHPPVGNLRARTPAGVPRTPAAAPRTPASTTRARTRTPAGISRTPASNIRTRTPATQARNRTPAAPTRGRTPAGTASRRRGNNPEVDDDIILLEGPPPSIKRGRIQGKVCSAVAVTELYNPNNGIQEALYLAPNM